MRGACFILICTMMGALLCPFGAEAKMYYILTPIVKHRISSHSNMNNTGKSDFEHRTSLQFLLQGENERTKFNLGAGMDYYWYHRTNDGSRTEYYAGLSGLTELNENCYLRLDGNWFHDYSLSNQLEETGELVTKNERVRYSIAPGISFRTSERDNHHITYTYGETDYEGDRYADSESSTVDWAWDHFQTERLVLMTRLFANWTDVTFADGKSDLFRVGAQYGGRYEITERFSALLLLGPTWGRTTYTSTLLDDAKSEMGYALDFILDYDLSEVSSVKAEYSRDSATAATGRFLDQDRLKLTYLNRLSIYTWIRLSAMYLHSESWGIGTETETDLYKLGAVLHHRFTEDFSVDVGVNWHESHNQISNSISNDFSVYIEFEQDLPFEL